MKPQHHADVALDAGGVGVLLLRDEKNAARQRAALR
jgi:hypothetical protein